VLAVFSHIIINVVLFLLILLALHVPESNLRFTLIGISMHMTLLRVSIDHENRESAEFLKLNRLRDKPSRHFAFISCALLKERIKLELGEKFFLMQSVLTCCSSRSSCECDEKFYDCLKTANTLVSRKIGITYFNVLRPKCFRKDHPVSECEKYEG